MKNLKRKQEDKLKLYEKNSKENFRAIILTYETKTFVVGNISQRRYCT